MDAIDQVCGKAGFIIDMDGVIYHGNRLIPGVRTPSCVGDRMDTDIVAGIKSEIETVLVLSGVTAEADLHKFAYRSDLILKTVGELAGKID